MSIQALNFSPISPFSLFSSHFKGGILNRQAAKREKYKEAASPVKPKDLKIENTKRFSLLFPWRSWRLGGLSFISIILIIYNLKQAGGLLRFWPFLRFVRSVDNSKFNRR
jgi:hypothetical protein